ncbi:hypothetical protein MA16_Dca015632 [Dendrobium catenatum]|uniref:Uncharacterized protein n=1 Tax=Dendrobium catenatum TaxID=906689 RepID=A0A2I0WJD7_9ASPA|nr:hypothetical protein MA16_Dca015632 [Dendrobium catenatum]
MLVRRMLHCKHYTFFMLCKDVELTSGKDLADIKPNFVELARCVGKGVIMTAPAPPGIGFDFFTRFFCPKMGVNEVSKLIRFCKVLMVE